jgi:hypothetical protein
MDVEMAALAVLLPTLFAFEWLVPGVRQLVVAKVRLVAEHLPALLAAVAEWTLSLASLGDGRGRLRGLDASSLKLGHLTLAINALSLLRLPPENLDTETQRGPNLARCRRQPRKFRPIFY